MKIFLTGGSGLLGSDLVPMARARGFEVVAPRSTEFDITDPLAVARLGAGELGKFDWVFNLAAYTKVDLAETNREEATGLNAVAPGYLGSACEALGARLLHFSTDYVFDGEKREPYVEDDAIHPIQFYGETKADGEAAVAASACGAIIARVSWLYGPHGPCFPQWVRDAFLARRKLRIVEDQFGAPSSTSEVSRMVLEMVAANAAPGMYHVCGGEAFSRLDYAKAALAAYFENGSEWAEVEIEGVPASEFPTPAARPAYSVMSAEKVSKLVTPHAPLADSLAWL